MVATLQVYSIGSATLQVYCIGSRINLFCQARNERYVLHIKWSHQNIGVPHR